MIQLFQHWFQQILEFTEFLTSTIPEPVVLFLLYATAIVAGRKLWIAFAKALITLNLDEIRNALAKTRAQGPYYAAEPKELRVVAAHQLFPAPKWWHEIVRDEKRRRPEDRHRDFV